MTRSPGARIAGCIARMEDGGAGGAAAVFLAATYLRGIAEGVLEESQTLGFRLETVASVEMTFLHGPAFYLTVFSLVALFLSVSARTSMARTARAVLLCSPVILIPPLVDAAIRSHGYLLHYFPDLHAAARAAALTFWPGADLPGVSPGMRVEILVACIGGAAYLRAKRPGGLSPVVGFLAVYLSALAAGSLPALYALLAGRGGAPESALFTPGGLVFSDSGKYALLHLLVSSTVLLAALARHHRTRLGDLLIAARPFRTAFYLFVTGFGLLLGFVFLRPHYPALAADPFLAPALLGVLATIFFLFQSQLLTNDLFDRPLDLVSRKRTSLTLGILDEGEARVAAAAAGILSLAFAATLGYAPFLITMTAHAVGFLYSSPPFRMKRFFPLNALAISFCILLSAYLGFSVFAGRHTVAAFPGGVAAFLFLCSALVVSIKDLPDEEGDREGGVQTLATLLGARRARIALGGAALSAYLFGPLALGRPVLLLAAVPCGVLTAHAILRGRERRVFALLFAALLVLGVCVFRGFVLPPESALPAPGEVSAFRAPPSEAGAVRAAIAELERGRESEAAATLTRALDLFPRSARLRLARARMLLDADPASARRDLHYAHACGTDRAVAATYLGDLDRRAGDFASARRHYSEALRIDPRSRAAKAGMARVEGAAPNR
ncbi:MAG: UbiA family prenyltransferase [Gemmatimonadota bacterium]|jgi:4-hydroxybenzoate polyprenyltransferase|nr:UbiA family prenyltransferase [Gemmatimonadota bacterium]MDP6801685.1 UbiA family prenyltransferase [Gemmatimonadota bacterium]